MFLRNLTASFFSEESLPEDGGKRFPRNSWNFLSDYKTSYVKRRYCHIQAVTSSNFTIF